MLAQFIIDLFIIAVVVAILWKICGKQLLNFLRENNAEGQELEDDIDRKKAELEELEQEAENLTEAVEITEKIRQKRAELDALNEKLAGLNTDQPGEDLLVPEIDESTEKEKTENSKKAGNKKAISE